MNEEREITLNDLTGEQRDLAETIGIDAYLKLVKDRGGTTIYIAKADKIENIKRDIRIVKEFNGYNEKFLALKYNLSDRTIREILSAYRQGFSGQQMSLFDGEG